MAELIKVSDFNGGDSDEGIRVRKEALVNGPSKFLREFMADGLEATLNRMSKWLVAALFGGIILWRHDSEVLWASMGCLLNFMEWLGTNIFTVTISGLALAFGSYLSWLRVSQRFHTVSQVVVGAALGSIFCILWSWSWNAYVLKAFISILWVRIVVVLGAAGFAWIFLYMWFVFRLGMRRNSLDKLMKAKLHSILVKIWRKCTLRSPNRWT
ncbi:hypothetical protein I3842_01G044000 [Carya illinoinensis]|uniref:Phosphatidic acid phosphatase type 2/haloperoxidase domain-containing protein n=2 Tax=Carya illinoinensis TaxID=32201 RepID=A0A922K3E1_CARIL|nr:hypothetical protein I3842_01G044000 [Carya illinoinensis]